MFWNYTPLLGCWLVAYMKVSLGIPETRKGSCHPGGETASWVPGIDPMDVIIFNGGTRWGPYEL